MKKFFRLLLVLTCVLASGFTYAHVIDELKLPPNIRVGVLDNGMHYVLVLKEEGVADFDFALIQRTGSLQEEESQRGLAHFLEHIAFNGSEHFAPGEMVRFCESHGIMYAMSLQANTGPERTLFYISNIRDDKEEVLDSCLLIMHDFACGMSLDPEEINKERGVIHEEWRMGSEGIANKHWATIWNNSRFGNRLPIGLMDVVDNFEPKKLRSYYEKWYHPENQLLYVQIKGTDEDKESVLRKWEEKIKRSFSDIPCRKHPAKIVRYGVDDNKRPIVIIEKGKNFAYDQLRVYQRYHTKPYNPKTKREYYRNKAIAEIALDLMKERWKNKNYKITKPERIGNSHTQSYIYIYGDTTVLSEAIPSIAQAIEHGFSAEEMNEVAGEKIISSRHTLGDNYSNNYFMERCNDVLHTFVFDEPCGICSDSLEYDSITSRDIQQFLKETFDGKVSNKSILCICKESEDRTYPTEESLLKAIEDGLHAKTSPYVAKKDEEMELTEPTTVGSIVSEKVLDTEWSPVKDYSTVRQLSLSNGATVLVHKGNSDHISAIRNSSVWADPFNQPVLRMWNGFESYRWDMRDEELMSDGASFGFEPEHIKYEMYSDSLELSLRKLYTDFTGGAASSIKDFAEAKPKLTLIARNKHSEWIDSLRSCIYGDFAPRYYRMSEKDVEVTDAERMQAVLREELSDASAFTFLLSGEDTASVNKLICKYIASLPSKNLQHSQRAKQCTIKGKDIVLHKEMKVPQTKVSVIWSTAYLPFTLENTYMTELLAKLAWQKLLSYVREELGATYSPSAAPITEYDSEGNAIYGLYISSTLNPDFTEKVKDYMLNILEVIAKECNDEDLIAAKETTGFLPFDGSPFYDITKFLAFMSLRNNGHAVNGDTEKAIKESTTLKDIQNFITIFQQNTEKSTLMELPK